MRAATAVHRRRRPALLEPLSPQRKWRAITLATLLLVPAFWSLLAGLVAVASDNGADDPAPGAAIALGLALIPFVFVVLAFASEHPSAPSAVVRAMGLCLLVAIPVSALAADAVTGIVAGAGAGGVAALRSDTGHSWRIRAGFVVIAASYSFVLVRVAGPVALISAPIFPFTSLGLADHYAEWRHERSSSGSGAAVPHTS